MLTHQCVDSRAQSDRDHVDHRQQNDGLIACGTVNEGGPDSEEGVAGGERAHSRERSAGTRITPGLSWIVIPWTFVALFGAVMSRTLLPRLSDGPVWATLSIVVGCVFLTFLAAAVSMTAEALVRR